MVSEFNQWREILPSNMAAGLFIERLLGNKQSRMVERIGSIPLTRWSVGHVWQDKHQSGRFFVFIRQYARICLYMKRHDLGQNPNELLVTSLVCKVGLFYSSVSNNQLFNTKNSFLQLFSRKATLKYEVLFKSVFFTNFFTWNCSKKC